MNLASALCVSSHSHSNINLTFFILGKKYMQAVTPTHIFCSNLLYYFAPSHQLLNPSLDVFFFFLSKYYMFTTMFFLMIKITNSDWRMKKQGCVYIYSHLTLSNWKRYCRIWNMLYTCMLSLCFLKIPLYITNKVGLEFEIEPNHLHWLR